MLSRDVFTLAEKRSFFERFLLVGWPMLHVDVEKAGVVLPDMVPKRFSRGLGIVNLQYGRDMPLPINDLEISDEGVKVTLSFNGESSLTFVPWTAVFAITVDDGKSQLGILSKSDYPTERVAMTMSASSVLDATLIQTKPKLRLV